MCFPTKIKPLYFTNHKPKFLPQFAKTAFTQASLTQIIKITLFPDKNRDCLAIFYSENGEAFPKYLYLD